MPKGRTAVLVMGLLAAMCGAGPAGAGAEQQEQGEPPVFEAEPMVVVATGEPEEPGTLPTSISVITRTEIERSGSLNLMDLLVREPGVWVSRQGGLGFGGAVSVRGFGGSPPTQVSVLVDGHASQMGIMGHILPSSYLLDNVERVEIMRGPGGARYGHMAVGGVINIVTRAAADEKKAFGTLATAGTYDVFGRQAWVAGGGGMTRYRGQWGRLATDGDHPFARYRADNWALAVDQELGGNWEAAVRAQQVVYKTFDQREVANAYAESRDPRYIEQEFDRQDYDVEFTRQRGERTVGLKAYRTDGEHEFEDGFHSQDYGDGVTVWERRPLAGGALRWGVDWGEYGGDIFSPPPLRNRFSRQETAAHFTIDTPAGGATKLSAGMRYTKPEDFDGEWLPQIGVFHPIGRGWSAFGSVRRGYRVPSFRELFLFGINNPELAPEEVWQYELGVRRALKGGGQAELALFRIDAANLILEGPRPAGAAPGPPKQLMNVAEARREGFEIGVRHPLGPRTAVYANFSYLDPGDVKLQTVGRKLAVGVDRRVGKWTLSGDLLYVARLYDLDQTNTLVEVPSFAVVNLKAARSLAPGLRAGIVVENLFDRDYRADPAYPYPMPGRTFRFQLETDW